MSLHRFYLPPEQWAHDLWLEGQEAKHLVQVLRLAPGEAMLLLDEICYNRLCHPVMRSLSYYTNFFDFSILRKLL